MYAKRRWSEINLTSHLFLLVWAALLFSSPGCGWAERTERERLAQGFLHPPDSTRPGVYWYFMDGNISREGMTADLESMKEAGIGSVLFLEVNVGIPRGNVDFMSPEWLGLFIHARKETERLGMTMKLGIGPGWTGSGGPWVKPEESMQHLVSSLLEVTGPSRLSTRLPLPKPKDPFFGEGNFTEGLKQIWLSYYADVAVLAFPAPARKSFVADASRKAAKPFYGNLHATESYIPHAEEKALYYRSPYSSAPQVQEFVPAPTEFGISPDDVSIEKKRIINLTDSLRPDGTLTWDVPPGRWIIMRFVGRNNGSLTRPAPLPGVGFECDKFDTSAFNAHFERFVKQLLPEDPVPWTGRRAGITSLHMDSWEMTAQNWTAAFRSEFQRRRGYDPLPFYPCYAGLIVDSPGMSERFLWDLRLTAQELVLENHAEHVRNVGRRHGLHLSIEPYDMNPTADIDLGSVADVPMCEFWLKGYGFNTTFSCIEAASIAHLLGKPVVAAESFTSWGGFHSYPGSIKNQGDWAFCIGINNFYYHTFVHSPFPDGIRPGMSMGPYGVHWDRAEPWWPMASAYHTYVARCSYLLQQGKTPAELLYLAPEGAPHVFRPPPSATVGDPFLPDRRGFNFDGCSPNLLMKHARVRGTRIAFESGAEYRVLVLPAFETMTPGLLQRIESLLSSGAIIVGGPPSQSPSLSGYPGCDTTLRRLALRIWGSGGTPEDVTERPYGNGRIFWGGELSRRDSTSLYPHYDATARLLRRLNVAEDFTSSSPIRYAHRTTDQLEIYFVSNTTDSNLSADCAFNVPSGGPELWNPVTGTISPVLDYRESDGRTLLRLDLAPYQSLFVVFNKTVDRAKEEEGNREEVSPVRLLKTIDGPWNVRFDTAWGGPASATFSRLQDWTERSEEGIKYYSGVATYSTTFELPESSLARLLLDLGEVRCIASVRLNGRALGILWCPPWQVDVGGAAKHGRNRLEIDVANLWINRLIGDEAFPDDGVAEGKFPGWLLTGMPRTSGRYAFSPVKFYDKSTPLERSGLLGPVRVLSTE